VSGFRQNLLHVGAGTHCNARADIRMPAQVFRGRMQHDVDAESVRILVDGTGEGVVDHRCGTVETRDVCHCLNVYEVE